MPSQLLPAPMLARVARRFKVLSDPHRLQLLNQLMVNGEMCVMDLMEATHQRQANVSKHLTIMAREGILQRRKQGLKVYYSISDPSIHGLCLLVCGRLHEEAAVHQERPNGAVSQR